MHAGISSRALSRTILRTQALACLQFWMHFSPSITDFHSISVSIATFFSPPPLEQRTR